MLVLTRTFELKNNMIHYFWCTLYDYEIPKINKLNLTKRSTNNQTILLKIVYQISAVKI